MHFDSGNCEFGYELAGMMPRAFYFHSQGEDVEVSTSAGMEPFYFFLPKKKINVKYRGNRSFCPNTFNIHSPNLPKKEWLVPDFKREFSQRPINLVSEKPIVVINNKYNTEWNGPPINFLSFEILGFLFELLTPNYTVIYNRPSPKYISSDGAESESFDDLAFLREFPDVLNLWDLWIIKKSCDFNDFQLRVLSRAEHKISVQGGNSILASLTGGSNHILAKHGEELGYKFCWYKDLSGADINYFERDESFKLGIESFFLKKSV